METFRVLSTGDELKEHKMVLQCQTCRTIVGDSNELVCVYTVGTDDHGSSDGDDEEVQYISIACASNVRLESQEMPSSTTKAMQKKKTKKTNKKRRMSTDNDDDSLAEQQSIIIVCDTCSNHIGRMHRGDNDDASSIVKDTFSFRLDAVDRYFFGSGDLRVIPPPPAADNASGGDHHQDSIEEEEEEEDTKNNTEEVDRMKQDLDDVKKTVAKMQEELSLHRKKLAQYDALFSESAD
mmetsp:Transcript_9107/g.18071  ORF Transcript_9107/g.18071 Transcript_9107/m.18071 type:complete len:237 (-) Transcript_9107:108-818(-)